MSTRFAWLPGLSAARDWFLDICRNVFRLPRPHTTPSLCLGHFLMPDHDARTIWAGSSGYLQLLPCGHIRKVPWPQSDEYLRQESLRDIARDHGVYQKVGNARHFAKMVGFSPDHGIVLQYFPKGNLKVFLEQTDESQISRTQRIQWAACVAEALSTLHAHRVIHCDLKPENVCLDDQLNAYLLDFGGSRTDDHPPMAMESVRFYLPRHLNDECTEVTDLFALGSTIYNFMTGHQPYHDLEDEEVEKLFANRQFPSVDGLPCGDVILKCWKQEMPTADEAFREILRCLPRLLAWKHRLDGLVHDILNRTWV